MFTLILIILLVISAFIYLRGMRDRNRPRMALGLILGILSALFFWFMDFWGDKLWFDAIGYNDRFWTLVLSQFGFVISGALLGVLFIGLLTYSVRGAKRPVRIIGIIVGALFGGVWGYSNWNIFLQYWFRVDSSVTEPIFQRDIGFYLFSLPFYNEIQGVLLGFSVISLVVAFLASFVQISGNQNPSIRFEAGGDGKYGSLFLSSGILVLLLAAGKYLDRFYLLYSSLGAVSGPGWTDYNIKLPALNIIVIVTIFLGLLILLPFARRWLIFLLRKISIEAGDTPGYVLGATGIILVVLWFLGLGVLPSIFQQFRVEPNEITFEKQYINNNIGLTRYGYKLHIVEEREFPAASTFTRDMVEKNKTIFENIRLWDWRALDAVLKQFQEIRLYYEFQDVDIDRYTTHTMESTAK